METNKARIYWFLSSMFSLLFVFAAFIAAIMLSNMGVISMPQASSGIVEMQNTLSAFSTIYVLSIAVALIAVFLVLSFMCGFAAAGS